jgi:hypothetical protein
MDGNQTVAPRMSVFGQEPSPHKVTVSGQSPVGSVSVKCHFSLWLSSALAPGADGRVKRFMFLAILIFRVSGYLHL